MAFMLGLGLTTITAMSSFSSKPAATTYHIVSDNGDRYTVTTSGSCSFGSSDCQFTTDLLPNANNEILKSELAEADVQIEQGIFVAP